jgi:aminopeptidase YwaD
VVHMDMVGGGPATKAVFHVTRGPMSLPSFVHDVAWAFAEFVNEQSYKFAATGRAEYPFIAPEGSKEPLRAVFSAYTMGSDHDVYQDSSFGIPAIYLNDWPDRYIHTNFDTAANIDTTKLKRAAFIGAASGYFLAHLSKEDEQPLKWVMISGEWEFDAASEPHNLQLSADERNNLVSRRIQYGLGMDNSLSAFAGWPLSRLAYPSGVDISGRRKNAGATGADVFRRKGELKGPLAVFGYDYFAERAKAAGVATPRLLSYDGLWGGGEEYAYEVLNFADGKLNTAEIRDAVAAEYGPVPVEMVLEYLRALEKIGVVEQLK